MGQMEPSGQAEEHCESDVYRETIYTQMMSVSTAITLCNEGLLQSAK